MPGKQKTPQTLIINSQEYIITKRKKINYKQHKTYGMSGLELTLEKVNAT